MAHRLHAVHGELDLQEDWRGALGTREHHGTGPVPSQHESWGLRELPQRQGQETQHVPTAVDDRELQGLGLQRGTGVRLVQRQAENVLNLQLIMPWHRWLDWALARRVPRRRGVLRRVVLDHGRGLLDVAYPRNDGGTLRTQGGGNVDFVDLHLDDAAVLLQPLGRDVEPLEVQEEGSPRRAEIRGAVVEVRGGMVERDGLARKVQHLHHSQRSCPADDVSGVEGPAGAPVVHVDPELLHHVVDQEVVGILAGPRGVAGLVDDGGLPLVGGELQPQVRVAGRLAEEVPVVTVEALCREGRDPQHALRLGVLEHCSVDLVLVLRQGDALHVWQDEGARHQRVYRAADLACQECAVRNMSDAREG
mmetsp:Transcript_59919/g.188158  ORF Transcript_59919/g.188158 Transcript_59919/m.188158 type:complete len:363 (-) Transcript_59919:508-1596(-)